MMLVQRNSSICVAISGGRVETNRRPKSRLLISRNDTGVNGLQYLIRCGCVQASCKPARAQGSHGENSKATADSIGGSICRHLPIIRLWVSA